MSQGSNVTVVQVAAPSNGFGLAGLIFSILGWFTCGLLCIPGAILSCIGLLFQPRGTAIAGLIVGFPGVFFFIFMGMGLVASFLGLGAATTAAVEQAREAARLAEAAAHAELHTEPAIEPALADYEPIVDLPSAAHAAEPTISSADAIAEPASLQEIPPATEPTASLAPAPEPSIDPTTIERTFSDQSGSFTVQARALSVTETHVELERTDTGRIVNVAIDRLSDADRDWLRANFPPPSSR